MSNKQLAIKQDFAPTLEQLKTGFEKLAKSTRTKFGQEKMHALTLFSSTYQRKVKTT